MPWPDKWLGLPVSGTRGLLLARAEPVRWLDQFERERPRDALKAKAWVWPLTFSPRLDLMPPAGRPKRRVGVLRQLMHLRVLLL